jgi:hypothetical protein
VQGAKPKPFALIPTSVLKPVNDVQAIWEMEIGSLGLLNTKIRKSKQPAQNVLEGSLATLVVTVPPNAADPHDTSLLTKNIVPASLKAKSSGEPLPPGAIVSAQTDGTRTNAAAIKMALVQNAFFMYRVFMVLALLE